MEKIKCCLNCVVNCYILVLFRYSSVCLYSYRVSSSYTNVFFLSVKLIEMNLHHFTLE